MAGSGEVHWEIKGSDRMGPIIIKAFAEPLIPSSVRRQSWGRMKYEAREPVKVIWRNLF